MFEPLNYVISPARNFKPIDEYVVESYISTLTSVNTATQVDHSQEHTFGVLSALLHHLGIQPDVDGILIVAL